MLYYNFNHKTVKYSQNDKHKNYSSITMSELETSEIKPIWDTMLEPGKQIYLPLFNGSRLFYLQDREWRQILTIIYM